jgi:hypothetical protein
MCDVVTDRTTPQFALSCAQTVAEVNAEAAQARSLALAALVARAERLHTLRTTAVAAALDWLHGHLPADEVLLREAFACALACAIFESWVRFCTPPQ